MRFQTFPTKQPYKTNIQNKHTKQTYKTNIQNKQKKTNKQNKQTHPTNQPTNQSTNQPTNKHTNKQKKTLHQKRGFETSNWSSRTLFRVFSFQTNIVEKGLSLQFEDIC